MGADVFVQRMGFTVQEKSAQCVRVQYRFGVPGVPGAQVEMIYTVEAQGALRLDAVYHGVPGAPELPCFGIKFETAACAHPLDGAFRRNLPRPLQGRGVRLPRGTPAH